jgi:hypothetical protein
MEPLDRSATVLALLAALLAGACSLGDVKRNPCTSDDQCAAAFGTGSLCAGGYCTDPGTSTGPNVACVPFDDATRVTKLLPDGGLPPLP